MYVREKSGRLYLVGKIKVDGKWKQKTISLNKNSNTVNKKWAEKNKDKLWQEFFNPVQDIEKTIEKSISLKEYGEYVLDITSNNRSNFSQKELFSKLNYLLEYFGNIDLTSIRATTIIKWQNDFLEKYASKTVKNYRGLLSLIFKFAVLDEIISKNPLDNVPSPKLKKVKLPNFYDFNDITKLINNSTGSFKNMIEFAFFTGVRTGELISLKWSDIDFKHNSFFIQRRLRDGDISTPKGYKIRMCYLFSQAKEALLRQYELTGDKSEWIWLTQYNEPYRTYDSLDRRFKKLCVTAGVNVGRFYDTRHSFATLMSQSGQSEAWIKQHMGHYEFSTTLKHYIGRLKPNVEVINNLKTG